MSEGRVVRPGGPGPGAGSDGDGGGQVRGGTPSQGGQVLQGVEVEPGGPAPELLLDLETDTDMLSEIRR